MISTRGTVLSPHRKRQSPTFLEKNERRTPSAQKNFTRQARVPNNQKLIQKNSNNKYLNKKDQKKSKPEIHIWKDGDWNYLQELSYRSLDSVVLKKGQKERILNFIKEFTDNQEWYDRTGVPYRTGILFSGPPGTGKTTMVRALASNLERDLRIINCGMMNDTTIMQALTEVPANCLILLEDFDSINATKKREEKSDRIEIFGVTLGGLLNAIDGVFSAEGRIIIATTNHPEKIDPALLRPGRFDLKEELGYTDGDMVDRIFKKFFPNHKKVNITIPNGISPAQIENSCLINKNNASAALLAIKDEAKKKETNN